uniref:Uncharacterized protein n=1 Tax=Knipowitschia caucasica TaxID=637954 RepID=A0AAV2LVZ2_KNICA
MDCISLTYSGLAPKGGDTFVILNLEKWLQKTSCFDEVCGCEDEALADSDQFSCRLTVVTVWYPDAAVNPTFTLRPERSPPVSVKPSSGDVSTVAAEDQSVSRDPHSSTPEHQQNKEPGSTLLFVGVTLAALVLLLAAVLLIFCRKIKGHMSKELPVSVDDRDDYEASHRSYEEIGPGVVSRPVEVSTVYASASFSKLTEDPADLYSLATAPGNQQQEEDNPSYTQIHFPIGPGGNSAPQSQSETLYSVVQPRPVDSLYSTAAFSQ